MRIYLLLAIFICDLVLAKPRPVTVKSLEAIAVYPVETVPATVLSLNKSTISAEIKGNIQKIHFEVGSSVTVNQVLVSIDCKDYELYLEQAEASKDAIQSDLKFTKWQLTRTKKLAHNNHASEELVRKHEATLSKLEANLKNQLALLQSAENDNARCEIKAPYSGIITERLVSVGEHVVPGTPIFSIIDLSNLEVEAKLYIAEAKQIIEANSIEYIENNYSYPVNIRTIIPIQDPKSRTQVIRLKFSSDLPLPGSAGRLKWKINKPAIPPELLRQLNDQLGVFVAIGNKAKFIVLPNAIEGQPIVITKNLPGPIIIDGRYSVENNSEIKIQQ